jgi:hypothetical protein
MSCSSAGILANELRDGSPLRRVQGDRRANEGASYSVGKDVDARPKAEHDNDRQRCLTNPLSANDHRIWLQRVQYACHSGRVSRGSAPASENRNPLISALAIHHGRVGVPKKCAAFLGVPRLLDPGSARARLRRARLAGMTSQGYARGWLASLAAETNCFANIPSSRASSFETSTAPIFFHC